MLLFIVWGNIIYGMNHILQGLSDGMKGGYILYIVTNCDYGSGFVETLMDSSLVHLMLVEKCDSVPLGLAHDGCTMYCHLVLSTLMTLLGPSADILYVGTQKDKLGMKFSKAI